MAGHRVGVRVRVSGARVSGAGGCTLAPPPPPGCRGTTTVGRGGLHHARGRLQRPKTSAGEAGAGPRLAVRVRARVSGAGVRVRAGYLRAALGVCWGAATRRRGLWHGWHAGVGLRLRPRRRWRLGCGRGRVRVRAKGARVRRCGWVHLGASPPPPGCRGTTTAGVAARSAGEAWMKT